MEAFIKGIPKCELHMHVTGNIEPEMAFMIAERNHLTLPYRSPEEMKKAYEFSDLLEFLNLYKEVETVLQTEQDIYDIFWDYFTRAHEDNCTHVEAHFHPYTLARERPHLGVGGIMNAAVSAIQDAKTKLNLTCYLILTVQRQEPEEVAFVQLEAIAPWLSYFVASGLANNERPFPPNLFIKYFEESRKRGLKTTIHAGEEGPSDYIEQSLSLLHADRIDHGVHAQDDPELVKKLAELQVPLTMCPLSNLRLKVVQKLEDHPLKRFLDAGCLVTINSDDPSYFRGYINDNFIETQKALNLTKEDIIKLAKNSYISSFLPEEEKQKGIAAIDEYVLNFHGF